MVKSFFLRMRRFRTYTCCLSHYPNSDTRQLCSSESMRLMASALSLFKKL
jgi:hypothetical protein